MKALSVTSFTKTVGCPSSNVLLSFRFNGLSPEIVTLVKYHLSGCDFCCAEIPLLAHYEKPLRGECKAPEIPINLRILAESLLGKSGLRKPSPSNAAKFGLSATDA